MDEVDESFRAAASCSSRRATLAWSSWTTCRRRRQPAQVFTWRLPMPPFYRSRSCASRKKPKNPLPAVSPTVAQRNAFRNNPYLLRESLRPLQEVIQAPGGIAQWRKPERYGFGGYAPWSRIEISDVGQGDTFRGFPSREVSGTTHADPLHSAGLPESPAHQFAM